MATTESTLIFSDHFNPNASLYTLIELPKEVADSFSEDIDAGHGDSNCLVIRGLETDEAVLCTSSTTYAIRSVQTSNSMLVCYPSASTVHSQADGFVYEIHDCTSSYQELTPCQPRLDRLRIMLEERLYKGPAEEARRDARRLNDDTRKEFFTLQDLRNIIQASDAELLQGLEELGAVEIDGYWRLLDPDYQESTLKYLLVSAVAEDMSFDQLLLSECISVMDTDTPEEIVKHMLKGFSESCEDTRNDTKFKLSEQKVGRFFGKQLLAKAENPRTELKTFLDLWREAVPEPLNVDITMLNGLCLLHEEPNGPVIQYFPKALLPLDAKSRLETLFQVRKKWLYADILPYISDLAPSTKKLDAILLKYARMSRVDDQAYYTSRYNATKS